MNVNQIKQSKKRTVKHFDIIIYTVFTSFNLSCGHLYSHGLSLVWVINHPIHCHRTEMETKPPVLSTVINHPIHSRGTERKRNHPYIQQL